MVWHQLESLAELILRGPPGDFVMPPQRHDVVQHGKRQVIRCGVSQDPVNLIPPEPHVPVDHAGHHESGDRTIELGKDVLDLQQVGVPVIRGDGQRHAPLVRGRHAVPQACHDIVDVLEGDAAFDQRRQGASQCARVVASSGPVWANEPMQHEHRAARHAKAGCDPTDHRNLKAAREYLLGEPHHGFSPLLTARDGGACGAVRLRLLENM